MQQTETASVQFKVERAQKIQWLSQKQKRYWWWSILHSRFEHLDSILALSQSHHHSHFEECKTDDSEWNSSEIIKKVTQYQWQYLHNWDDVFSKKSVKLLCYDDVHEKYAQINDSRYCSQRSRWWALKEELATQKKERIINWQSWEYFAQS